MRGDRSRGYTSKNGVILLTDALTDKVLDYKVLAKYLHTEKRKSVERRI